MQPGDENDGSEPEAGPAAGLELDLDAGAATGAEDDEVWFDAEALERASTVELDASGHRLLRPPFDEDLLDPRQATDWLSAATLPGPPSAGPRGHGLGPGFDGLLGGLGAGRTVWLRSDDGLQGAARHLLGQLAEGFSLASADGAQRPTTPALVLCSSPRREAQLWAVSRWTGFAQRIYRLGRRGALALTGDVESEVDGAFAAARASLEGRLGRARPFLRHVDAGIGLRGGELVAHLTDAIAAWRDELLAEGASDVVPVVVVEDLEAWIGRRRNGRAAPEAVPTLWAALTGRAHAHRWALMVHAGSGPPAGTHPPPTVLSLAGAPSRDDARRIGLELGRHEPAAAPARRDVLPLSWDPETGRLAPDSSESHGET